MWPPDLMPPEEEPLPQMEAAPPVAPPGLPGMPGMPPGAPPGMAPEAMPPPGMGLPPPGMGLDPGMGMDPMGGGGPGMLGAVAEDPRQSAFVRELAAQLAEGSRALVDYTIKLDDEELLRWGGYLRDEIDSYRSDTDPRRDLVEQWRNDYEVQPVSSFRWDGAAEVNSPFCHLYCANHAMRLDTQIVQVDPPLSVVARKPEALEFSTQIEEAITASLDEADWKIVATQVHSELALQGNVFLRVTYEEDIVRRPEPTAEWDEVVYLRALDAGLEPEDAFMSAVKVDRKGQPVIGLRWIEEKRDCGPRLKVVAWEDGIVIPASVRDPADARAIGERLMISGGELLAGSKRGKYLKDAVETLLENPSDVIPGDRATRLDQQGTDPEATTEPAEGAVDPTFRWYECYEMAVQADWNDDGQAEWALVTLHYGTASILRITYLPYEHGRPCYYLMRYIIRTNELWGMGIAELIACIQDAHTALLNQIIDSGDLALNMRGNWWYEKGSGFDPSKWVLEMARPIPVDSVQGILPMQIQALSPEHYGLHQTFKDLGDLLTATSNPSLGKSTDQDKTLGEVQLVMGASNLIFEQIASAVALQWADIWDLFRWTLAQFGESGEVRYRKSAASGMMIAGPGGQQMPAAQINGQMVPAPGGYAFGTIPAEVLRADVDLVPTGLSQMGDANARLQQAMLVLQTILTHPLTMQNVPVLRATLDTFLQAVRYPIRQKVMDEIDKALMAQQMVQAMEMQGAAAAGLGGGLQEGEEGARQANQAEDQANLDMQAQQQEMQQQPPPPPQQPLARP